MNTRTLAILRRQRGAAVGVTLFVIVALFLTSLIAGTLSGGVGSSHNYQAIFTDASGLLPGDDVRISGVRVGKVQSVQLDGRDARVGFSLADGQHLYPQTTATVEFLNLLGQRFIDLQSSGTGTPLPQGAVLAVNQTRVGLDLTAIFNAFRPLFDMIRPADVNELADNIIQVLQGQGAALQNLSAQTAALTQTLAGRDTVIADVVDNLTAVMGTVNAHRSEIRSMIGDLNGLTKVIADNRARIGATIDSVNSAAAQFTALVLAGGPSVVRDVNDLASWSAAINAIAPEIGSGLQGTRDLLAGYVRTLGLGSYLNTYVCGSKVQFGPAAPINLSPSNAHSRRCP